MFYIGVGGNEGTDPRRTLLQAIASLQGDPLLEEVRASSLYLTQPVSSLPQPPYWNGVVEGKTALSPVELLEKLQKIERSLGKIPKAQEAPRPIDLDLLLHGPHQLGTPFLQLPHPRMRERVFVLHPLAELTTLIFWPGEGWVSTHALLQEASLGPLLLHPS